MLNSGFDRNIVAKLEALVAEIKFHDEKDNKLLIKWLDDVKNAPDIVMNSTYKGNENNGTMSPVSTGQYNFENIKNLIKS